jgi:hypothetical protein
VKRRRPARGEPPPEPRPADPPRIDDRSPAEKAAWDAAFVEACSRFGQGAVVGRNLHTGGVHVGRRWQGEWIVKGDGATWQEAFKNAKPVPARSPRG